MKITPEIKEQINELFCRYGVKAQVAREIGCSAATVSRYIDPNYVPKAQREVHEFCGETGHADWLIEELANTIAVEKLCELSKLSAAEWEDMKALQKEVYA